MSGATTLNNSKLKGKFVDLVEQPKNLAVCQSSTPHNFECWSIRARHLQNETYTVDSWPIL